MKETREILRSYIRMTRSMSRRFRRYFGQMDLTFPQALVLTALQEDGDMPISHLAEYTGSANSTVSGIVDRLEKLELVKRVRSDEDRRVIYVALTDKYRAALQNEQTNVNDCFSDVLGKLTASELDGIATVLDKLCRVLDESDEKK